MWGIPAVFSSLTGESVCDDDVSVVIFVFIYTCGVFPRFFFPLTGESVCDDDASVVIFVFIDTCGVFSRFFLRLPVRVSVMSVMVM